MSTLSKDDRLVELMSEFLETGKPEEEKVKDGFGQPGLDNKKMLDAIQEHRAEIDSLKEKLTDLSELLKVEKKEVTEGVHKITAPEIIALQSSITNHSTQIGDLVYKQKMLKTDIERKKQPKNTNSFGSMGWLLLASNVLLWSVLGYFLWQHFGGLNKNTPAVANKQMTGRKSANLALTNQVAQDAKRSDYDKSAKLISAVNDSIKSKTNTTDSEFPSSKGAKLSENNLSELVVAKAAVRQSENVIQSPLIVKNEAAKIAKPIEAKESIKKTVVKNQKPKRTRIESTIKNNNQTKVEERIRSSNPIENESMPDVTFGD